MKCTPHGNNSCFQFKTILMIDFQGLLFIEASLQLCKLYHVGKYRLCVDVVGKIFRPCDGDHTSWEDESVTDW